MVSRVSVFVPEDVEVVRARMIAEDNVVKKKAGRGTIRVALLYPSLPTVALDSLSYQMLYYWLNSLDDVYAEQFMLDFDGTPLTRSIETGTPLRDFDYVVISVHYELDFVNILRVLLEAGVEVYSEKREKPVVIAGGPPVIANPVPLSPFVDVLAVGEIEPLMPVLVDGMAGYRGDKRAFLENLGAERGFYVPLLHGGEEVVFNYARELSKEFSPSVQLQLLDPRAKWRRRTAVETSRGCFRMCAFCLEGHIFRGVRERPFEQVRRIVEEGSAGNRTRHVKLVSLSFFDHSEADRILEWLVNEGYSFSIPSLRADTLNERRLEYIRLGGQKTLTVAPETLSPSLAIAIRKHIGYSLIRELSLSARKLGYTGLKVYLMVGIPGEREEDLRLTAEKLRQLASETGFKGERALKVTVSPLVPKPHTPLQYAPFVGIQEARRRIEIIRRELRGLADVREYDPRLAYIQTIIARGDSMLSQVLLYWALKGGGLGGWRKALRVTGVDVQRYLAPSPEEEPPWGFIRLPGVRGTR